LVIISPSWSPSWHAVSPERLSRYALPFLPLWWTWISFTITWQRLETDGLEQRLFTFLCMVPGAGMAVSARDALGGEWADGSGGSHVLGRVLIVFRWARAAYHGSRFRPVAKYYVTGFSLSAVRFLPAFASPGPFKFSLGGAGLLADLCTPWLSIRAQARLPRPGTAKLVERHGLFVISGSARWWSASSPVCRRAGCPPSAVPDSVCSVSRSASKGGGSTSTSSPVGRPAVRSCAPLAGSWLLPAAVGAALLVMGLMEPTLARQPDEPTHPWRSPFVKWLAAGLRFAVAGIASFASVATLAVVLAALVLPMVHGASMWFRQDLA
jgi:hypothetical protein